MGPLKQIAAVTRIAFQTLPSRWGASLVILSGMACVSGALVAILSMAIGFSATVNANGRADRVLVMSRNAQSEYGSALGRGEASIIADAPGVAEINGKPVISADSLSYSLVHKRVDGFDAFVTVRGVGLAGPSLRPEIRIVSGRMFQPGKHEVIVGKDAQAAFTGLQIGDRIRLADGLWDVTGSFESGSDEHESEILADADTLMSALRTKTYNGVWVRLISPNAFNGFKKALTANPALSVDLERETDYNAEQAQFLDTLLKVVAFGVGGTLGIGAIFGALNTMYSSISTRMLEIATLRAIGFGGGPVIVSVLAEAILLAALGAAFGALLAWWIFNGNQHVFGGLVSHLAVTPALMFGAILFACALGFLAGIFPAARAASCPVVEALRRR